jgi:hypothetical protein
MGFAILKTDTASGSSVGYDQIKRLMGSRGVLVRVNFRGFFRVMLSLKVMSMRRMCVMSRFCVIAGFVMFGCFAVMSGSVFVMFCSLKMVFGTLVLCHKVLLNKVYSVWPTPRNALVRRLAQANNLRISSATHVGNLRLLNDRAFASSVLPVEENFHR